MPRPYQKALVEILVTRLRHFFVPSAVKFGFTVQVISAAERFSSPAGAAATAWCRAKQECGPGRGATPCSAALSQTLLTQCHAQLSLSFANPPNTLFGIYMDAVVLGHPPMHEARTNQRLPRVAEGTFRVRCRAWCQA
jgi:hypothetical protein